MPPLFQVIALPISLPPPPPPPPLSQSMHGTKENYFDVFDREQNQVLKKTRTAFFFLSAYLLNLWINPLGERALNGLSVLVLFCLLVPRLE